MNKVKLRKFVENNAKKLKRSKKSLMQNPKTCILRPLYIPKNEFMKKFDMTLKEYKQYTLTSCKFLSKKDITNALVWIKEFTK